LTKDVKRTSKGGDKRGGEKVGAQIRERRNYEKGNKKKEPEMT